MNIVLFILSIAIYLSYGFSNFIFIIFSMLSSFIAARFLKRKNGKVILGLAIFVNAALLVMSKFLPYANINFISSIGISYYTLQVISYLVDVYKGKYEAEKNLFYFALYIFYIPHIFIGPIIRYDEMREQILKKKRIKLENLEDGFLRIFWGLFKKFVISGRVAIIVGTISSNLEIYNGAFAFFAMLLYGIQLYTDFSGGIDIVLGVSKVADIDLKENFDSPYLSENIKEFWRRWHISLSSWLRDYIYIPLGGSRCSKFRKAINTLITFLVSGLWHGVNYILWGFIHGIFVLLGDSYKTKFKNLNRVINYIIVSLLWSFFIWPTTGEAVQAMLSVLTNLNISELAQNILNLGLSVGDYIVLIISILMLFIFDGKKDKILSYIKSKSFERKLVFIGIFALIVITFGIYGIGFEVNDFIYSKF